MDASPLYERTLITANQPIKYRGEPVCQTFRDQFTEAMDQAYWAIVSDLRRLWLLFKQNHVGVIQVV
jgi:hypothetical protein